LQAAESKAEHLQGAPAGNRRIGKAMGLFIGTL
jgi:hypothetical protein